MSTTDHDPTTRRLSEDGVQTVRHLGPSLVVLHGPGLGQRLAVGTRPVRIGRSRDADLRLTDVSVSRHHCEVRLEAGRYLLRDCGAINRTRLNGEPVTEAELRDGDLIAIGVCLVKFLAADNPELAYHVELERQLNLDELTGLINRRHFIARLDAAIAEALLQGEALCLGFIDVDWFKSINDRFGHAAGDAVLCEIATRLRRALPEQAVLGRIGGEEFALLLPRTELAAAIAVAEALRRVIGAAPLAVERTQQRLTISLGLAVLGVHGRERSALMRAADRALYRAKSAGRDCVRTAE